MPGTVSSIAKTAAQPRGGYLPPKTFQKLQYDDEKPLNPMETIPPWLIGLTVDNMTRFMLSHDFEASFAVPLEGLRQAKSTDQLIHKMKERITGLDDTSIYAASLLSIFETWARTPIAARKNKPEELQPDDATRKNIAIMVERSMKFFADYGPVNKFGFTFGPPEINEKTMPEMVGKVIRGEKLGGYTGTVGAGDGDYLTVDGLWDMKVSKNRLTPQQTLQILMYWIMGQHSGREEFKNVHKIGIFNPRLNIAYVKEVADIDKEVIAAVERDVIRY